MKPLDYYYELRQLGYRVAHSLKGYWYAACDDVMYTTPNGSIEELYDYIMS